MQACIEKSSHFPILKCGWKGKGGQKHVKIQNLAFYLICLLDKEHLICLFDWLMLITVDYTIVREIFSSLNYK